uniref:Protein ZBED8like [Oreochromis niloticus] n=1 Tax=Lepeophtheirus salmonis TaxID=72036 RepID=A0A0K2UE32_LEPSM
MKNRNKLLFCKSNLRMALAKVKSRISELVSEKQQQKIL